MLKIIVILVRATFAALVFTVASDITIKDLIGEIRYPFRVQRISIVGLVLVPAVTAVICKFFNVDIIVMAVVLVAAGGSG